jgi:hypothetical protein
VTTLTRSRLVLVAAVGVVSVMASCAGWEIQVAATALAVIAATVITWRWDTAWVPDRAYQQWKRDTQAAIDALDPSDIDGMTQAELNDVINTGTISTALLRDIL